jgi:hypothetical protein
VQLQNIQMVYSLAPLAQGGLKQLQVLLENHRPNVVIVDTFLALVGGSNAKRDPLRSEYAEMNLLHDLALQHNTAIVLVHHLRKSVIGESGVDGVAGTTGMTAAADSIWTLKREDGDACTLNIVGRECEEQTLALKFTTGTPFGWELIGTGKQLRESNEETEISSLLQHEGALKPTRVALLLKANANRTRSAMYAMAERGILGRNTDGSYFLCGNSNKTEERW